MITDVSILLSRKMKEFALESLISPVRYTRLTTLLRLIVRFALQQYVKLILDYSDVFEQAVTEDLRNYDDRSQFFVRREVEQ